MPKGTPANKTPVVAEVTVNEATVTEAAAEKVTKKAVVELQDNDLVACVAQIPNMSYFDNKTGDRYVWENVGDVEEISFATLKDMYRNAGSYIKNLWFTFNDDRVIEKFRLQKTYDDYKDLVTASTYKASQIKRIEEMSGRMNQPIKNTIFARLKAFIENGQITDALIIRRLEKLYDADLMHMIKTEE